MFKKLFKKSMVKQKFSNIPHYVQDDYMWSGRDYSTFADKAYIKNVIATRAINVVAVAASSIPINLYRFIGKEKKFRLKSHTLTSILNRPNCNMSRVAFIKSLIIYKQISGNAYILKIGEHQPKELHLLRPDRMEVIPGRDCMPIGYHYKIGEYKKTYYVNKLTGECDILHLKNFHPTNDWYGLSPVEAASYSIDQHNQASLWNQSMLKNGARPSGAFIVNSKEGDANLSDEQYMRLKEQINEYYMGPKNTGRPILLEGGLDWREMSISPKEMDFLKSKYNSAREIALAFGVPPQLLGIPGDNTYSNLVEARVSLWEETILPMLNEIIESLNIWLTPQFGDDLELGYDKDAIEVLLQKRQKIWQYIENASFLTTNEKREVFGYSPINDNEVNK
jgi:HK97 family phage portal protein